MKMEIPQSFWDKITVFCRCGLCSSQKLPCTDCLEATKRANGWDDAELERRRDIERRYSCTPRL
jgi:hypothetical protein